MQSVGPAPAHLGGLRTPAHRLALISNASKVMLKILQARLQQYVDHELPGVQAGFRKTEEPEIKLPTSVGSSKSKRIPGKYLLLLY